MTKFEPDKILAYAAALDGDIGVQVVRVVEDQRVRRYYMGTVYGVGVATDRGHKFDLYADALLTAREFVKQCADIVAARAITKEQT